MMQQLRYLFRKLSRSPLFTVVSVLTLGLGIGANAAIFSVINSVLIKPLPFEDPERLVGVWHTAPGLGFDEVNQSPALYFTYRDGSRVFEDSGLWDNDRVSVTGQDEPERVSVLRLTDGTLPLLGARTALGRVFTAAEDTPESPRTVILSHEYWQRRFGGAADAVGKPLTIDGRPHEIIGVMPEDFRFLSIEHDLIIPFRFDRARTRSGDFSYQGVARLRPGKTIEDAQEDMSRLIPLSVENFPGGLTLEMLQQARFAPRLRPFKHDLVGDIGGVLWVLFGTVAIVLLIACANVANLFLVRAEGRTLELALRNALGAKLSRVARELLSESVLLGALGGLVGLIFAFASIRVLRSFGPDNLPRLDQISIDSTVLLFTLGISLIAGLMFGLLPVFKLARPSLLDAIKDASRGNSENKNRQFARSVLVVGQIALALTLLVGSGLMIRSFQALRLVDPGFSDPDQVLSIRIFVPEAEVEDIMEAERTHKEIIERIQGIPGVESVGVSSSVTMDGWDSNDAFYVEEFPTPEGQLPAIRRFKWISPNYHETMRNPLLAGRTFTWADLDNIADVAIITANLASEYWDSPAEAIGKRVKTGGPRGRWREIVGVVGNVHDDGVSQDAVPVAYWPMVVRNTDDDTDLSGRRSMAYAIRTSRWGTTGFLDEIRREVWEVNGNLPVARVVTLQELLDDSMARAAFTLVMLGIAATLALTLGIVGIYGVISYGVAQRTREIGVRMALGASRSEVSFMVLRRGLVLTSIGLVVGLGASFGLTRLMSALLYGVDPVDPLTFGAMAVVLGAVALLASYLPARRAARVSPMVALRWE